MRSAVVAIIPARWASTRLPEKLIRPVAGRSVLEHTFHRVASCGRIDRVVVAVDDPRMAELVDRFGGTSVMTSPDCPSGTDRLAQACERIESVENDTIIVNVQGDEPEIEPATIEAVVALMQSDREIELASAAAPIRDPDRLADPSCVKAIAAWRTIPGAGQGGPGSAPEAAVVGRALYFSRAAIPFPRDVSEAQLAEALRDDPPLAHQHIGIYAYRRKFLRWFVVQPPSPLEQVERLEQLRTIEAGRHVALVRVRSAAPGIDTAEDFARFRDSIEGR